MKIYLKYCNESWQYVDKIGDLAEHESFLTSDTDYKVTAILAILSSYSRDI